MQQKLVKSLMGALTVEITNAPSKEVEDYYNEQYMKSLNDTTISSDAFNELAKYINDLWD